MFSNPEQIVAKLLIQEGMRVADFGAGIGHYVKACSPRVGTTGKVYAVEVQKGLIKKLEDDIRKWGLTNVECIWGDIETRNGTKLADNSIDIIVISNVLFQVEDKLGLIDEAKRILKDKGKVLLVDWKGSFNNMGPASLHVVDENTATELFRKRGFKFVEKIEINTYQYGIIFSDE